MKTIITSLIALLGASSVAHAHSGFDRLQVPGFELVQEASRPRAGLIAWEPDGANLNFQSAECRPDILEKLATTNSSNLSQDADRVRRYLEHCQSGLNRGLKEGLGAMVSIGTMDFNATANPNIRRVKIGLKDGTKLTGFMGLKDDAVKRPFVIVQCGIMCGIDFPMAHGLVMQIFEETPFNALILSNATSSDIIRDNQSFVVGGMQEGAGLIEVAKMLRAKGSSLASRIDSVHIIGQSLGGHSALFASVYASHDSVKNVVQSVTAVCPVTNLKDSMANIQKLKGLMGLITEMEFESTLMEAAAYSPTINYVNRAGTFDLEKKLNVLVRAYYGGLQNKIADGRVVLPAPLTNMKMASMDEFWNASNIANYASTITVPTLLFGAKNDLVVPFAVNSHALSETAKSVGNKQIGMAFVDYGAHCGESVAIGWPTVTSLLRGYILRNSPNFQKIAKDKSISLSGFIAERDASVRKFESIAWTAQPGDSYLTGTLASANGSQVCGSTHDDSTKASCRAPGIVIRLPYSALAGSLPLQTPVTTADAKRNARWANSNFQLVDQSGASVFESGNTPTRVIFKQYQ